MKIAVLFEGAGGVTEGIRQAGYETVGYEYWQTAVDTARANGHDSRLHDLSDESRDDEIPAAPLFWISSPCQPFSSAGDQEGEFDERDGFPWALRIIAKKLPAVAIFENVKGLTFAKHADYFGSILLRLTELGYEWEYKVLNTADYGVPQTRERCIIVARRDGGRITWPAVTHTEQPGMFTKPWVTMAQALGWGSGLVGTYRRGVGMVERHGERPPWPLDEPAPTVHRNSEKDGLLRAGSETGKFTHRRSLDRPAPTLQFGHAASDWAWVLNTRTLRGIVDPEAEAAPTVTTVPAQWCWERPATTVACDPRVIAPGRHDPERSGSQMAGAIRLTIAELACLQGFPPGYIFTGTKTAQAKQVGNAVPPVLAQVIVEANLPAALERVA